jgi:polyisoprenoid-binding protein YceI
MTDLTATTGTWTLDPSHTYIGFTAKHAMVTTVRGSFLDFEGTLHLDGEQPAQSTANLVIQASSFDSGNEQRDGHVKGDDFLDVEHFPTLTFTSTSVKADGNEFVLTGDLTIRGTTRPVEITGELEGLEADPFGNQRVGFSGSATISRKDFGLTWNVALESGGILVSDKVKIVLDVSAIKQLVNA